MLLLFQLLLLFKLLLFLLLLFAGCIHWFHSGCVSGAVEHLRDEYGRKGILCHAVHSPGRSLGYDPAAAHPGLSSDVAAGKQAVHRAHRTRSAAFLMVCARV